MSIPEPHAPTRRSWYPLALLGLILASAVQALPSLPPELLQRLPQAQRADLLARERLLQSLDASQRAALQRRIQAWHALAAAERRTLHEAWQAWQALSPAERAAVQVAAAHRARLPRDEQLALRAQFQALDASERHGWLLGPDLGRDWPRLQPLLAQVPPEQRAPLLQALRQMDRSQRAELGVLAQRVPPQERDALRRELITTPAAQRAQWLRMRVGG